MKISALVVRSVFVASFVATFVASSAQALPLFGNFPQEFANDNEAARNFDFRGIVGISDCSGSLVRFDDSQDSDAAMVLSNGHCVGMIAPGTVLLNTRSNKSFTILNQSAKNLGTVTAQKIIYATMTDTDLSLFLLKETFQNIESKFNIKPLTLARTAPVVGTNIEVISGYWKRGFSCAIESTVPTLKEADWTWSDSIRYSRPGCEVIGGTSGSPVIEAGTRTVIAVNNTVNESGKQCAMNNPCEVAADGTRFAQKGYGYAQQTFWLYSCRNADGAIDLNTAGCRLPR